MESRRPEKRPKGGDRPDGVVRSINVKTGSLKRWFAGLQLKREKKTSVRSDELRYWLSEYRGCQLSIVDSGASDDARSELCASL